MRLFDILSLISIILIITALRSLVNVFPSIMACVFRWKECVNMEASIKNYKDRDIIALALIPPFCLTAVKFGLYSPQFVEGLNEELRTGAVFGVFFIYFILRLTVSAIVRPGKIGQKTYKTGNRTSYTFFVLLALLLVCLGGILSFFDASPAAIRSAMLWISAGIYTLFLIRKTQIFNSNCSIFTAFLYLCALEILPTGLLIASAVIF